ncbi:MAG: ABC transporter substrate-binding protein [Chloroflexota bacterium]
MVMLRSEQKNRSVVGRSVVGRSVVGRSVVGRSVVGKSVVFLLSLVLVLTACTNDVSDIAEQLPAISDTTDYASTRPIVKIGLIAPFEGLYRQTGYSALDAVRMSIAEYPADLLAESEIDLMPLAMDDSNVPTHTQRTAQKMLKDKTVHAIVGPFTPETAFAAASELSTMNLTQSIWWGNPLSAVEGQLVQPTPDAFDTTWALPLIRAYADFVQTNYNSQRLVLLGSSAGWPDLSSEEWQAEIGHSIVLATKENSQWDLVELMADDAVFWMGSATDGADMFFLVQEQRVQLNAKIPFGMGPQGGDIVFTNHAGAGISSVYWVTWLNDGFAGWHEAHSHLQMPQQNYLVYLTTTAIIDQLLGLSTHTQIGAWKPFIFELKPDGQSVMIE